MAKPIGYYTSYTPGDGSLLDRMEQQWGSQLEQLNDADRVYLISQVTVLIWSDIKKHRSARIDVDQLARELTRLNLDNKLGLVQALVEQIKSSNSLQDNASTENLDSEKLDNSTI